MNAPLITDGLQSTLAGLGTARDKATSVAYAEVQYDEQQLTLAYRTSWLARKVVEIPALDSMRRWRAWQAQEDQIELLEAEELRLELPQKLLRARTLARLYGQAFLYFDLGDAADTPVAVERVKKGGVRFVTVLTHHHLVAGELEQDPLSQRFGTPKWYDVVGAARGQARVHPSRIVRLVGNVRPEIDMVGGEYVADSVLVALMQAVKHFDGTAANIASLVFEAKVDVIKVKGLMQIAGNAYEEARLLARYSLAATAKGNNGMLLLDGDSEEYEQKNSSFTHLADILDRFAQNSAGGADIPMTRLFGQSPGGMNASGDSDIRNYYDRIAADQNLVLRPALAPLDEVLIRSALGARPPEVHYTWNSLWQMTDKERSELGTAGANMAKTLKDTGLIPDEVLADSIVALLTQDGALPGLEGSYTEFFEGGENDKEEFYAEEEPPEETPPGGGGQPAGFQDEQARAPKGTPNGGQWVKMGGGGGSPTDKAAAKVATTKYSAEQVKALTGKKKEDLSHYEKKVLAKYKKALSEEQAAANAKPEAPDMVGYLNQGMIEGPDGKMMPSGLKISMEPTPDDPDLVAAFEEEFGVPFGPAADDPYGGPEGVAASVAVVNAMSPEVAALVLKNGGDIHPDVKAALEKKAVPDMVGYLSQGMEVNAAGQVVPKNLVKKSPSELAADKQFEEAMNPGASQAKQAALASVATAKYPAEKIESLLSKDYKDLSMYEKKKLAAYKKALQEGKSGTAAKAAMATAALAVDPSSSAAQMAFKEIGKKHKGMQVDTVKKLATGEWQPDPAKPWQVAAKNEGAEYLKTGVVAKALPQPKSAYSIETGLANDPPPISAGDQSSYVKWTGVMTQYEQSAATKYTGSWHSTINNQLRNGASLNDSDTAYATRLDGAISKSRAATDMVVVRGVKQSAMAKLVSHGDIKPGTIFKDKGYVSTTSEPYVASSFSGGGYGIKIRVPKGSKILPVKAISHHPHESEFVLPRGSSFKVSSFNPDTGIITVDLVG